VDLKNVRQIHVMDPWWHLNRIEQVIGRGIRLCSHKALPFEKRNAQIFLYVSVHGNMETVDHYLYRYSENKAKKIGKISRILKETSMDCVMNHPQLRTMESFGFTIPQTLSNGKKIDFPLGDASFTLSCDFMDCNYACSYSAEKPTIESEIYDVNKLIDKIKQLYKKAYIYTRKELHTELNIRGRVSYRQLYEALTLMIDHKLTFTDNLSRVGYLINSSEDTNCSAMCSKRTVSMVLADRSVTDFIARSDRSGPGGLLMDSIAKGTTFCSNGFEREGVGNQLSGGSSKAPPPLKTFPFFFEA
jgi:hypothetical protein